MQQLQLFSDRLSLRLIQENDLEVIHQLHSIPETDRFNALGIPKDLDETKKIILPWIMENKQEEIRNYTFAVELNNDQSFIGLFGFKTSRNQYQRGEVWFKTDVAFWGKGYTTEALNLVLDFGFNELKLHRIQAGCAVDNIASVKVLEKVGMIREGRGRQILPLKTGWSDNFEYSILESDKRPLFLKK
ncbi:MAG: GNAT family N-acetyltransferase [Flavobacteriales bacterium]|nr:GNAT family N-acetyltransferase [Flavobacteriales bacterium]